MKVQLIVIGQSHIQPAIKDKEKFVTPSSYEEDLVAYSQLKIMQIILADYPNAAILIEGNFQDVVPTERHDHLKKKFERIFPTQIQDIDFNQLDDIQKKALNTNSYSVQILFQLGLITHIYQSAAKKFNTQEFMQQYIESCLKLLPNFPMLFVKAYRKSTIPSAFAIIPEDADEYEAYQAAIRKNNPNFFYQREKEALDFVLRAAQLSEKNQVVLVMGVTHIPGITALVQEEYGDLITLEKIFDSRHGFLCQERRTQLSLEQSYALKAYQAGNYEMAAKYYQKAADFWNAAPGSTPTREKNLLAAEYNLGSTFFKLSNNYEQLHYYDGAMAHLKKAYQIAKTVPKVDSSKYYDRYSEASKDFHKVQRQQLTLFFDTMPGCPHTLIAEYADESEIASACDIM